MKKVIDMATWKGRKHYEWFKKYDDPNYNFNKLLDVSKAVEFTRKNNLSFFITVLYVFTKALNTIKEFRLREDHGEVVEYDVIHPAYTVMTDEGVFENCENDYVEDFATFYKLTQNAINKIKKGVNDNSYNDLERVDQYYFTCVPWTSYISATHPIILDSTVSVPRIGWCKYELDDFNRYKMVITFGVYHGLIDGYPLCMGLNKIQEYLDKIEEIIKL